MEEEYAREEEQEPDKWYNPFISFEFPLMAPSPSKSIPNLDAQREKGKGSMETSSSNVDCLKGPIEALGKLIEPLQKDP